MEQSDQPSEATKPPKATFKHYRGLIIMTCAFYLSLLVMIGIVFVAIALTSK